MGCGGSGVETRQTNCRIVVVDDSSLFPIPKVGYACLHLP